VIDQITIDLSKLSETALLGAFGIMALLVLLVPIALKLAGLSGEQIVDLLTSTMRFFINMLQAFRAQNKEPGE